MAEMLIFHHARGLTPGVLAFAERMRAAEHEAHVPDLFDGRTFDSEEATFFSYPGDRHLFAEESLPAYEADAAQRAEARVLELLA